MIVHNSPRPELLEGNALLNHILGAEEHYLGGVSEEERAAAVEQIAQTLSREGSAPYIIYNGASSARGALGYVEAAAEIWEQISAVTLGSRGPKATVSTWPSRASSIWVWTLFRSKP